MWCILLCKSIPPRVISDRHIQHCCRGSVVVDAMVCTIVGDVATVAAVVVVVAAAAVAVDTAIKLVVNKFAKGSRFCAEGSITGLLLM